MTLRSPHPSHQSTMGINRGSVLPFQGQEMGPHCEAYKVLLSLLIVVILGTMAIGFLASKDEKPAAASKDPNSLSAHVAGMSAPATSDDAPEELIFPTPAATYPDRVPMLARGIGAAPGAIVCSTQDKVDMMFELYSSAWESQAQDKIMGDTRDAERA
jgi:hypothetical protein